MQITSTEIVVLGAGFAGSLVALGCRRLGRDVLLLDKARHPRFAIGESSTPVANRVLRDLAIRYELPRLLPLVKYGPWQRAYPHLGSGLKRGFSYFEHRVGAPFQPDAAHRNELLVAASGDDESSDTHWVRADVDQFLADEARAAGVALWEDARLTRLEPHAAGGWTLAGQRRDAAPADRKDGDRPFEIRARFLIDGTGEASAIARSLGIPAHTDTLHTRSRSLFTHFRNVGSWRRWLETHGGDVVSHPFPCDDAAQHMLLDGAWMWVLRFNQGVTSVGLAIDEARHPLNPAHSPEQEWAGWMRAYPSVGELLSHVEIVDPPGRLIRTGRIQRKSGQAAGRDWAALPHTAGFIDPLHSTGIAHSLCGVERLLDILAGSWDRPELAARLCAYQDALFRELDLIDLMVDGCYRTLGRFRLFAAWSMLYFAAATTYERLRARDGYDPRLWFLNAGDDAFRELVERLYRELKQVARTDEAERAFERRLADRITPYNRVGLMDPVAQNLYRHTVSPE